MNVSKSIIFDIDELHKRIDYLKSKFNSNYNMVYAVKANTFVIKEADSKKQSKEWTEFSKCFNDFMDFAGPYFVPDKNGKYKTIDKKNYDKINRLFYIILKATRDFLKIDARDETERIKKDIVQTLNDEFLLKSYEKFKDIDTTKETNLQKINKKDLDKNKNVKSEITRKVAKLLGKEHLLDDIVENTNEPTLDKNEEKSNVKISRTCESHTNKCSYRNS